MKKALPVIMAALLLLCPAAVTANSGPVTIEGTSGFAMLPDGDTPIAVNCEALTFDITREPGAARVTALYQMENTGGAVTQTMLFPFVSTMSEQGSQIEVKADGQPVEFEVVRLSSVRPDDFASGQPYDMRRIIDETAQLLAQPIFDDYAVTVYEFTIAEETAVPITMQEGDTLVFSGFTAFSGFDVQEGPNVELGAHDIGREYPAAIAVIRGDPVVHAEATPVQMPLSEYASMAWEQDMGGAMPEGFPEYLAAYLTDPNALFSIHNTISVTDVGGLYMHEEALFAIVYEVPFEAGQTRRVSVEYTLNATRDRTNTDDYTSSYTYLLSPASGWKDFGALDITILPHESAPNLISSTVPFTKDDNVYSASLTGLPDRELTFTLYGEEVAGQTDYTVFIVVAVILAVAVVTAVVVGRRKRHGQN